MRSFGKVMLLVVLAVVIIIFSVNPQSAPVRQDLTFQDVLGALGGMFVIVLLIERATEIAISIWRQSAADQLKEEIESLSKDKTKVDDLSAKTKELAAYQSETKSNALLIGFSISVVVCAAGLGLLDTIVDTARANREFIRGVDVILTSGLLAGGSDSFHQFVRALETFFTESKKKMEAKTTPP